MWPRRASLELLILLPQLSESWNYSSGPPCQLSCSLLEKGIHSSHPISHKVNKTEEGELGALAQNLGLLAQLPELSGSGLTSGNPRRNPLCYCSASI